jgi:hypothetical protein
VLARFHLAGAVVHRTDREGTLRLRWDDRMLWFWSDGCSCRVPVL